VFNRKWAVHASVSVRSHLDQVPHPEPPAAIATSSRIMSCTSPLRTNLTRGSLLSRI
jgi:hypothetical protein